MDERPECDPANYLLRFFYYNKKDPRLFLPKKDPDMGTTVNFAQPGAVVVFLAMISFFVFVVSMIASRQQ